MEQWRIDFINDNRENLDQLLNVDDELVTTLYSEQALDDEDIAKLNNIDSRNLTEKFLNLLTQKRDGFTLLFKAASETGRTELTRLLQTSFERHQPTEIFKPEEKEYSPSKKKARESTDQPCSSSTAGSISVLATPVPGTKIFYFSPISNIIGLGASAVVYKGYFGDISVPAAVKMFKKGCCKIFKNELNICKTFIPEKGKKSVNVVQLLDWKEEPNEYFLCMELGKRNLEEEIPHLHLRKDRMKIIGYMKNCTDGLSYLHQRRILHRDIKPQNIIIFEYVDGPVAKIGDFGFSRKLNHSEGSLSQGSGTKAYMPPEAIFAMEKEVTFFTTISVDIFSLGLVFHYCLSGGEHPFEINGQCAVNIKNENFPPHSLDCPELLTANHLIFCMLEYNPSNRPSICQVSNHPMFWGFEKTLQFFKDLCRVPKTLWDKADTCYNKFYKFSHNQQTFDWFVDIDPRLRQRRSKGWKKYSKNSLNSLIELVRDKHEHKDDWVLGLWNDVFVEYGGQKDQFSKEIFIKYFLCKFPDITIVLFCIFLKLHKHMTDGEIRDTYYKEYYTKFKVGKERHIVALLRNLKI